MGKTIVESSLLHWSEKEKEENLRRMSRFIVNANAMHCGVAAQKSYRNSYNKWLNDNN